MFCQAACDHGRTTILQHWSPLSTPQATLGALWSCGMVLAHTCAVSAVRHVLAPGMQRQAQTVRPPLREGDSAPPPQRGAKRQALRVETCVPLWLGWVVRGWHGTQLALALAAPAWGTRCVVLAVRGVYRGGAMPGAWVGWPAHTKH